MRSSTFTLRGSANVVIALLVKGTCKNTHLKQNFKKASSGIAGKQKIKKTKVLKNCVYMYFLKQKLY